MAPVFSAVLPLVGMASWGFTRLDATMKAAVYSISCVLNIILALVGASLLKRSLRIREVCRDNFSRLDQVGFARQNELKTYEVAYALSAKLDSKPFKRGCLLVGGFGDTPSLFTKLAPHLAEAGVFYTAPRTPGWGRTDFHEADVITWQEWVLRYKEDLDLVRGICEEVTVVAHSTGVLIAGYLAQTYPVDRMVFTGPNFISNPTDLWAKKLLTHRLWGELVSWGLRVVPKRKRKGRPVDCLNEEVYEKGYYLTAFPTNALKEMWRLQDVLRDPWKVTKEVIMLMGEEDRSVAPLADQVQHIRRWVPESASFRYAYVPNAAHGLLGETAPVVEHVAGVVLGTVAMPVKESHQGAPQTSS